MKRISYRDNDSSKMSITFDNGVYKLKCNCSKLYIGKTYRNFKTSYNGHISEIQLPEACSNPFCYWACFTNESY